MKATRMDIMRKVITSILVLLFVGFVSVEIIASNNTIVKTGFQLIELNLRTQDYNESIRRTDEMTEEQEVIEQQRAEIYNSEDFLVRVYSNAPAIIKIILLIMALLMYLVIVAVWLYIIYELYVSLAKTIKPKKRNSGIKKT